MGGGGQPGGGQPGASISLLAIDLIARLFGWWFKGGRISRDGEVGTQWACWKLGMGPLAGSARGSQLSLPNKLPHATRYDVESSADAGSFGLAMTVQCSVLPRCSPTPLLAVSGSPANQSHRYRGTTATGRVRYFVVNEFLVSSI